MNVPMVDIDQSIADRETDGEVNDMALTRDFKETILARVRRDPRFRNALLKEGIETLLAGHVDTGKSILRDYISPACPYHPPP